jgi:hypothetical protein
MVYVTHRFSTTPYLDDKKRIRAQLDTMLILNYRLMCSLLSHYFKYPADINVAQATFANLSYRFILKKLGNWMLWYDHRCKEIIADNSIHREILNKFNNDLTITLAVADIQGRVRDVLKNIYAEFIKVLEKGDKYSTTSSTGIGADGEEKILDMTGGLAEYITYINSISHDYNSLYRDDIITLVDNLVVGGNKRILDATIKWISENNMHHEYETLNKHLLTYAFNYLNDHEYLKNKRNLQSFLFELKNGLMTSKSNDPDLILARNSGLTIVKLANKKVTIGKSTMLATRTMLMLYLCLRTFIKN